MRGRGGRNQPFGNKILYSENEDKENANGGGGRTHSGSLQKGFVVLFLTDSKGSSQLKTQLRKQDSYQELKASSAEQTLCQGPGLPPAHSERATVSCAAEEEICTSLSLRHPKRTRAEPRINGQFPVIYLMELFLAPNSFTSSQ